MTAKRNVTGKHTTITQNKFVRQYIRHGKSEVSALEKGNRHQRRAAKVLKGTPRNEQR